MKPKSLTLKTFAYKALMIFTCVTFNVAGFIKCDAQSITGKWNHRSSKMFLTAKGVKTLGKPFILDETPTVRSATIEFKADHNFIEKGSTPGNPNSVTITGTWSLAGNQLKTKLHPKQQDPKNNPKGDDLPTNITITISGNTLIIITPYPAGGNEIISKKEDTYIKI